ncbi:MAG: hypothetical protein HZRFUVUK_001999 [Candidatus Fervidibacterota bacterium]
MSKLLSLHSEREEEIKRRLNEFEEVGRSASDLELFEELVFCICAAGYSARGAMRCVEAIKPALMDGDVDEIAQMMSFHRYAKSRARYIVHTREYLKRELGFKLKEKLSSIADHYERRDFLALNRDIKGIGYKEASHFLRNIGYKGYAILDRHVLRCLNELGVLEDERQPKTRRQYIEAEEKVKEFSQRIGISVDELDLLLWSYRTGEILK